MIRLALVLAALALAGGAAFLVMSAPAPRGNGDLAGLTGDPARGALVYAAAGCGSCHTAPGAKGEAALVLSGGQRLPSPFGTFLAPNISSDPEAGIGGWSLDAFATAVRDGISPEGSHYFPAMPYAAYGHMTGQDIADLKAHLDTMPPSPAASLPHEVPFPFNIRRSLGVWKLLFLDQDYVLTAPATPEVERGRYIVEALAHCGECHTPRNMLGGLKRGEWLAGAPNPEGKGRVPDIRPVALTWSADEILAYLTTGFTPDFDVVGGPMAHVVDNLARLPEADRRAVVAYLKALPGG